MNCEHIRAQLASWLNGSLTRAEKTEVEKHLIHCLHCQEEFAENKQLWTAMSQVRIAVPGEKMKAQFDTMLDEFKETAKTENKNAPPGWIRNLTGFVCLSWHCKLHSVFCSLV